jgi:hypothetical protein
MSQGDLYLKNNPLVVLRFFLGMGVLCTIAPWLTLQSLTCDRSTPIVGQCQVRQTVLGLPIKTVPLKTLKGAEVRTSITGRISHRIVLQTQADDIQLLPISTPNSAALATMASQIDSFIQNPQQTHLTVTQDERVFGFQLGICFALLGPIVAILVARADV